MTEAVADIRCRGLTKRFGDVLAVDSVDLDIASGEFFTLLGPSGSGKTTTLRMIAGFEIPDGGSIELAGEDVSRLPPYDRPVNTVFQDYALFPHMTVQQNVEYGLSVKRVAKDERRQRAQGALHMVQLEGYGSRKPSQLSGGQRQRVALARAIVNRPRVLLLDEPLGALDLKLRQEMQIELKSIQQEVGITFVYVTHDQEEALTMSDRLAVFNEGRIEQIGPPAQVYEHPESEFIAAFVGVSNVIERGGRTYTVRPEKIHMLEDGEEPAAELHVEAGVVRDVQYAGPFTRYYVAARARRRAPGAHTEPRRGLGAGARDERSHGAPGMAPGTGVGHRRIRGRIRMRTRRKRVAAWASLGMLVAALSVVAAGCGGGDDSASTEIEGLGSTLEEIQANAKDEGEVNLVIWAGYADKSWADAFTKQTGCTVKTKDGASSDDMVDLMGTGAYDGVSASGDATLRLIANGDVAPVNFDLIPNYADVFEGLKDQSYNTVDGVGYGVPHGRGPNLMVWRTDTLPAEQRHLGADLARNRLQGQALDLRQPDLHRRRGPVPQGHAAGSQHHGSVRARRGPVQCSGRPAEAAAAEHRRVLGRRDVREAGHDVQVGRERGRHDVAVPGQPDGCGEAARARRLDRPEGRHDRVVGHVDDREEGRASELHVPLDGLHHLPGGECEGRGVLRRGAVERERVQPDHGPEPLRDLPRGRRGLLGQRLLLEHAPGRLRRRQG